MKKYIHKITATMVAMIMTIMILPLSENVSVSAADVGNKFIDNGIEYEITSTDTNEVMVIKNDYKYSGDIIIPATVSYNETDYNVTSIGEDVFEDCTMLKSITVDENNENYSSENDVLFNKGKTEIIRYPSKKSGDSYTIPISVTSIGDGAFKYCNKLTNINIPNNVTSIGDSAFFTCPNLTSINISNSVTSIGKWAFKYCGFKNINIPNSVTSIDHGAFLYCSSLETIDIPDSVTSIESFTFKGCSSLETIDIPDSVTSISYDAFAGTAWYDNQANGVVYAGKVFYKYKGEAPENTTITLENDTKGIAAQAFENCSNITNINIPKSVISIGRAAFKNCSNLESIIIPDGVKSIERSTFEDCINLQSITIPNSVTEIATDTFKNCSNLNADNVILRYVDNTNLMYSLASDIKDKGITNFNGASSVKNVIIDDSITSLGDSAFSGFSSLTSIDIPDGVTSIGERAFNNCSSLTSIDIPDNITLIKDDTFNNCSGLTTIDIPDGVTSIGENAFSDCSGLTSIDIPDNVTSIESSAFYGCTNLATIDIPDSVTSIGYKSFNNTKWYDNKPNNEVVYAGKVFYNYKGDMLENTIITLEPDTKGIAKLAFSGCTNLAGINIPESVTSIGRSAFNDCTKLESITIPNSVTSIEPCTFFGCTNLVDINIPESVTSIGAGAFNTCTGLESITIPNSVTSIGDWSFYNCNLSADDITINYVDNTKPISAVADLIKDKYVDDFTGVSSVKKVVINNNVTSLPENAFNGCSNLTNITIPESVTSIDNNAFVGCDNLKNIVTIDNSLDISATSLGNFYKVHLNLNGETTTDSTPLIQNVKSADAIIYPVIIKTGYKLSWNTQADGKGTDYDDTTVITEDVTLYAKWTEIVDAQIPNFTTNLSGETTYTKDNTATPLDGTATVSDGGIVTYQWYKNDENNATSGEEISGETTATFTPETTTVGTTYYYVVATNTNDSATGTKTVTATSNIAKVTVKEVNIPTPDPAPDPTPTYTPDPHDKETTTEKISEVAKNLEDGNKLTIKLTAENKIVKGDVLKEIKGKDIEVKIEVADEIEWSFSGKDIPENWNTKDINFGINTEKSKVPAETLKDFTAGKKSKTLSLDYDGAFGFEMKLSVHIGYFNEGQYANIYYYNPTTKELEFIESSKINSAGNAKFDFEHASDYVILVSDKAVSASDKVDTTTTTSADESNPVTGNAMPISIAVFSLATVVVVTKKKLVK